MHRWGPPGLIALAGCADGAAATAPAVDAAAGPPLAIATAVGASWIEEEVVEGRVDVALLGERRTIEHRARTRARFEVRAVEGGAPSQVAMTVLEREGRTLGGERDLGALPRFLAGRRLAIGARLALPGDVADALVGLPGRMTTLGLTLRHDGASFDVDGLHAVSLEGVDATVMIDGTVAIELATGQPVETVLDGAVQLDLPAGNGAGTIHLRRSRI